MKSKAILLLCTLLFGCGARKIEVSWQYDPGAKLADLKTYAWVPGPQPAVSDPRLDDATIDRRIRAAVDRALTEKGYRKAEADGSDFWIGYYAKLASHVDSSELRGYSGYEARLAGFGRARGWNVGGPPITSARVHDVGYLNLYLVDPATKEPVWHGVASAEIGRKDDLEKRDARLLEVSRKILEKLPPP